MAEAQKRSFSRPDETRAFAHVQIELVKIADGLIRRVTLQPGWRWSQDLGPIAKTEWCQASHFQYHLSGRLRVRMSDGTEFDLGPGDVTFLPKGHDTWVVGDEPVVLIDWYKAGDPARTWAAGEVGRNPR